MTWDQSTIERARRLVTNGQPYSKIAVRLGVTKGALAGLVYRQRWRQTPERAEKTRQRAAERAEKVRRQAAARAVAKAPQIIVEARPAAKPKARRTGRKHHPVWTPARIATVLTRHALGDRDAAIAADLGISGSAIMRLRQAAGQLGRSPFAVEMAHLGERVAALESRLATFDRETAAASARLVRRLDEIIAANKREIVVLSERLTGLEAALRRHDRETAAAIKRKSVVVATQDGLRGRLYRIEQRLKIFG